MEQEQTLEELGLKLRDSNLQISELKEEVNKNKPEGAWVKDDSAINCKSCTKPFNLTRRRVSTKVLFFNNFIHTYNFFVIASL